MDLLQMSASGALLIFAACLFRALTLRRLPKGTFLFLWWAAALRLLLPWKLPSQLSIYSLAQALRRTPLSSVPAASVPTMTGNPVVILPVTPPAEAVPVSVPFPVKTLVWFTVAVLLALWFLVSHIRWRRRFRESLPVNHPYVDQWRKKRLHIQVRASDRISAPLTYRLLCPVILLPKTMDLSDESALRCILTHEEVHIRRLDGLFKLVLAAALCVHWFNPAVWLLYVLANQDMELRCDEAVLDALGRDSRELYALTLIRMAENGHMPLCSFSRKNGMEERILAIMNFKKKSTVTWVFALVLAACITTVFATSAMTGEKTALSNGTEDPDAKFYAEMSAEIAAEWREVLAPYIPFGLTYEFNDPDLDGNGLTMYFEGQEVRGILDSESGNWITEHTGNSAYSDGAAELYAVYDGSKLVGLRFATEEEQAAFTEARESSTDIRAAEQLRESVQFDNDVCSFTIPEREGRWNIWISGRAVMEDGTDMSIRYLESESEKGEWVPGQTYSFEEKTRKIEELVMEVSLNDASATFDLLSDLAGLPTDFGAEAPPVLPASKADVPEGISMTWPVNDGWKAAIGSQNPNGEAHDGVDISGMEKGTPIYAAAAGTVKDIGFDAKDGNYVRLDHGSGLETYYACCQSVQVKTGDTVTLGQTIATVGSTGTSTGPHLHFEVLLNGVQQDPLDCFKSGGTDAASPAGVQAPEEEPSELSLAMQKALDEAKQ